MSRFNILRFSFFASLLLLLSGTAAAQEEVSTAELFSSTLSGSEGPGNASDFQNAAPRPDWGNPIFGEQLITASHGAVILQRQQDNDSLIPLNTMAGLELDVLLHLRSIKFEFGWLGVFSGTTTQYLPALAGDSLPTSPPIAFTSNGLLSTIYSSDLNSFEFNLRVPITTSFSGIAGLRYINLHEAVHLTAQTTSDELGWKTTTDNNLFGLQGGGDWMLSRIGSFELNAIGKAGVYVNSIEQEGMIVGFPAPGFVIVNDSTSQVAFLGELKLLGTHHFSDYFAVTAGYQAMWFSGVALGQNQFSSVNFASGSGIHASASPLLHGATIQAVVSW
jgi:hypothetical protein